MPDETTAPRRTFHPLPAGALLHSPELRPPFVLLETMRGDRRNECSYLFNDPVEVVSADDPDAVGAALRRIDEARAEGLWAAGYFTYELGRALEPSLSPPTSGTALAWFLVCRAPRRFDHLRGTFSPPLPLPLPAPLQPGAFSITAAAFSPSPTDYQRAVGTIQAHIAAGDTYQVNYCGTCSFTAAGDPRSLYLSLRENQPVPYGAFIDTGRERVLSFTPELFFRVRDGIVTARPMKGTAPRGRWPAEDAIQAARLAADPKSRAENVMIVDLIRNDLGRICETGSVTVTDLCRVEAYDTLLQMTSTVRGRLLRHLTVEDLLRALFPCGSVTGAPKIRTMEIIDSLEERPRGVYCGAIGYFAPGGDAVLSVPIRTAVITGSRGELGLGSGIVADSSPGEEYRECLLKGRFLTRRREPLTLIETIRWDPGEGYLWLDDHLARLAESAGYFRIPFSDADLRRLLGDTAAAFQGPRRVRLTLSRGGEAAVTDGPLAPPPRTPVPVGISLHRVDPADPHLYHKTSRRRLFDEELDAARPRGLREVLFLNERGECTEGSYTNLFLLRKGRLETPPRESGLLPGVLRGRLLRLQRGPVVERVLTPADLATADAIFVGNSVRGLVRAVLRPEPGEG